MRGRYVAGVGAIAVAAATYILFARPWHLRWGASVRRAPRPSPATTSSRAPISPRPAPSPSAPQPARLWPWIAQLGQGRGGFYSYDFLENLAGCDIHSAGRIVPRWQDIKVGDEVKLAPAVGLGVAALEPGRSLVLRGGIPVGNTPPPYDFTWAWVLRDEPDGTSRLLVRERYAYTRPWARFLVEPVEAVSFVMSQKMLRGIRDRAEQMT